MVHRTNIEEAVVSPDGNDGGNQHLGASGVSGAQKPARRTSKSFRPQQIPDQRVGIDTDSTHAERRVRRGSRYLFADHP